MYFVDLLAKLARAPLRHNQSFLASAEQAMIARLLPRIPSTVTSLHFTYLGAGGAALAALALVGCRWSLSWLPVFLAGLALNWLGTAFDGAVARYRGEERPSLGLFEHFADLSSQIVLIMAFGLSPFFSLLSASIVLVCYLLFSAYAYLRAAAKHVEQMAYIGIGRTEFRILMALWPLAALLLGLNVRGGQGLTQVDLVMIILATVAVCGLGAKVALDARKIDAADKQHDA